MAEASPLAVSPAAPGAPVAPPVIPEDVTVVAPAANETASPALPSPGAATAPGTEVAAGDAGNGAARRSAVAAPTTTRPTPPPPAAPVNPVPGLMAQAEQAMAAKRYNDAIAKFGDVLKLEPQNTEAATRKLHAQGERASMGRYFFTAVTMSEGKASGGGLKGFDGGSVVKSQCECAAHLRGRPDQSRARGAVRRLDLPAERQQEGHQAAVDRGLGDRERLLLEPRRSRW